MANIKISELTALTPPDAADLVPVTDSSASQTKRTTVGEIVGIVNGDVDVADDGTATISELPVSKLQDGDARQLLQTDAAGTGVEWTSNVDVPGTLDVTGAATLDGALNVAGLASLDGGIDVDGAFTVANTSGNIATSGTLGVTGQSTLASAAISDLTSGRVVLAGTSGELEDNAGLTFNGTQLDVDGDVVITGDLTVEGASTILETETVKVEDKNIELGVVASPTDVTADGGGITLKGATDKTINWVNATDAWTSSERFSVPLGSEAAPSLTFTGDPNTGIYSPGADQLAISVNGTQALYINADGDILVADGNRMEIDEIRARDGAGLKLYDDAGAGIFVKDGGNVGMGTVSPGSPLDVQFSSSTAYVPTTGASASISIFNTSNSTNAYSALALSTFGSGSGSTTGKVSLVALPNAVPYASDFAIQQRTASGAFRENLRITHDGKVGIDTAPSYQLQLSTDSAGKPSTNTWTIVSDERIKEEIELADLDLCYEAVKSIPLKRFKWKDEVYTEEQAYDRRKLGWIAQDVEAVFPKAVRQHEFKYNQVFKEVVIPAVPAELDDDGNVITEEQPEQIEKGELISEEVIEDCRDLNSDQLYAAMYGAIQKLISKVELLEAEVQALKNA